MLRSQNLKERRFFVNNIKPDIVYRIHKAYSVWKTYKRQDAMNGNHKVRFYNWWGGNYEQMWLYRFAENTGILNGAKRNLNICSVFGSREILRYVSGGAKIFFSGENLHLPNHIAYKDALLEDKDCKLSIGFEKNNDERSIRFPLWLTYVFEPNLDEKRIRECCEQLRYPIIGERNKFSCLISKADISGIRTEMFRNLNKYGSIDCPSVLFHNDDSLKEQFEDNKVKYMRQYHFNICPENSNAYGYCTEKVFEAIAAGCIPIYWGDNNRPEPHILNHKAIIFWDQKSNGVDACMQIRELYKDLDKLKVFCAQPRLLPNAEDEIIGMLYQLHKRLKVLVC